MSAKNSRAARLAFVSILVVGGLAGVTATLAQEQSKAQQGCITGVNKATTGVAKAQGGNNGSCLSSAASAINPSVINSCITSDLKGKMAKAQAKLSTTIASKCASPPDFGFTDATTAYDSAVEQEIALFRDVFGDDLPAAVISKSSSSAGAKCQAAVQKTYEKLVQAQLRAFGACKKNGLKAGTITSQATLAACLGDMTTDPKGRIGKAEAKLSDALGKKCGGVNIDNAFPGDCAASGFAACVRDLGACRACLLLDAADDTGAYCDMTDNGVADGSCVDPRRCGNGTTESGEECDDGNNTDGDCCSATCEAEPSGQACADDANGCTNDQCNGSGACVHPNNSNPCDDGLFCNGTDTCGGGSCSVHASDPCGGGPECNNTCNDDDNNCAAPSGTACTDDGNVCTNDTCNGSGTCAHPANTAPCDDGLYCNGSDTCAASVCTHTGNPCTGGGECADTCSEAGDTCNEPAGTQCT
jgi:cysteine-rich repeat protein